MAELAYIVFGLIVGSFLSVCIYRIPASRDDLELGYPDWDSSEKEEDQPEQDKEPKEVAKEKIIKGINCPKRSLCPKCHNQLPWHHNIPVISWIILRGKCGFCSTPIPFRYPLVEMLTAFFSLLSFSMFGLTATAFVIFVFVCALIVISFIDIDYYIIPNVISLPGVLIGVILAAINHFFHIFNAPIVPGLKECFWGLMLGAGFLWGFAELYYLLRKKEGLGMGDVKLLGMTGALFGAQGSLYTIFFGSIFGSVLGVLMIVLSGRKWSKPFPFGPYLALGTVIYIFAGDKLITWWFSMLLGDSVVVVR